VQAATARHLIRSRGARSSLSLRGCSGFCVRPMRPRLVVGRDDPGHRRDGPHAFRRANITWRQRVGGSAVQAGKIAGTATGATALDGASRGSSAGRRPPPSLRTPGRLRITAVDAVTSPVGVCLGNRFPTANTAKTACEPRTTAPRLPDTNNHPGIQSATAHLIWLPTGFAIGIVASASDPLRAPLRRGSSVWPRRVSCAMLKTDSPSPHQDQRPKNCPKIGLHLTLCCPGGCLHLARRHLLLPKFVGRQGEKIGVWTERLPR
jgi:hypothetical protein